MLLITLALASCNLDGTTGIFREIAQSKEPLSIRYRQLLGQKGSELYFRTLKGVERVDALKNNTPVATSADGKLIQAAALSGSDNKVFYITNDVAELNAGLVHVVDTLTLTATTIAVTTAEAPSITSELSIKGLYANSMVLVSGKDGAGKKVLDLLEYDSVADTFTTPLASFPFPEVPADYDLESVIQQTGHEQDGLGKHRSSLVSFVKPNGTNPPLFKHYVAYTTDGDASSKKHIGSNSIKVANYLYNPTINDHIYILSTNGKLYYAGTFSLPEPSWIELSDTGRAFEAGAFAYTVVDVTENHLITKPYLKTSPLIVFTFPQAYTTGIVVQKTTVQAGYAKELSLASIVSAQEKPSPPAGTTTLLVATDENGMYDISINNAKANVDTAANGTSSAAEGYTF